MRIRQVEDATATVFRVEGEIDCNTGEELRARIVEATRDSRRVVVDLSGVRFLDSVGLSQLLLIHRALTEQSATMALAGATRIVRDMLAITRLDTVFDVIDGPV
jgi:anti-sigma B factor antagonist